MRLRLALVSTLRAMTAAWPRYTLEALGTAVCALLVAAVAAKAGPMIPIALLAGGLVVAAFAQSAKLAAGAWLVVGMAVPYWITTPAGITDIPPQIAMGACALVAFAPRVLNTRWVAVDALFAGLISALTLAWLIDDVGNSAYFQLSLHAVIGYLVGRVIAPMAGLGWTARAIAIGGGLVGLWAVVEYTAGVHLFTGLTGFAEGAIWAPTLDRGGAVRSEAAFGHPIVLGAVLASTIPFIALAPNVRYRPLLFALVVAGLATTASRGPVVAAGLTTLLVLVGGGRALVKPRVRQALVVIALVAALPAVNWMLNGSDTEQQDSARYRAVLYDRFAGDTQLVGVADGVHRAPGGRRMWRNLGSIDSTPVATALIYGWVAALLLVAGLLIAVWAALKRPANPAAIALAGQIPVLMTVALITQYRAWVFFLAGLAAAAAVAAPTRPRAGAAA